MRCHAAQRGSFAVAAVLGCGPPVGVGSSDGADGTVSQAAAEETTQGTAAAAWMSGWYSSVSVVQGSLNNAGFDESGTWYLFRADGEFHEISFKKYYDIATKVRRWEPISESEARVFVSDDLGDSDGWYQITNQRGPAQCSVAEFAWNDGEGNLSSRRSLFLGKVCYVEWPDQIPDERPTFYRAWCDEPPPGCFPDGCPCEDAG
jgi:hypothetical protein